VKDRSFGRRDLLRAAGLTLLVPVFLREAFASVEQRGSRLVILMQANGTHQATFWPDPSTASSPILEPLLGNPALSAKTLVVQGVSNTTQGLGNEHDRGFNSLWTGVAPVGTPEDSFGGGASIDQVLKKALAPKVLFPTLNCGVLAADVAPKNGHRRSFSYVAPMQQIPTEIDPYRLYSRLFRGSDGDPAVVQRRLALQRSVLDATARDLAALSARLGPKQREKLDAHATGLREYEQRLSAALDTNGVCARPAAPQAGVDVTLEDNVPLLADLMLGLVAQALACNLTRIVTFPLGLCGNQWFYRWLGIGKDSHSEIAHADPNDDSNPAVSAQMTQISRWSAEQVASFATRLEAIPEAEGGSVLDSSLVIWANENATGSHRMDNLPLVFVGRAAGRLKQTGLLSTGTQTHHQLCTSVLGLMGVQAAGYGSQPDCGPLSGLVF
jgi:hypothetical protein